MSCIPLCMNDRFVASFFIATSLFFFQAAEVLQTLVVLKVMDSTHAETDVFCKTGSGFVKIG